MRFKVPKRQPESFKASALYLAGLTKGHSPDRVEFVFGHNLQTTDPRAAAAVMEATAAKSVRCKQPEYHFIVTFDPEDAAKGKVTERVKREIAGKVIEDMGLTEHQALVYSHQDTDHPHLHFLVNRVHPVRGLAYDRHQDGKRLKEIVRARAIEYDLNVLKDRELIRDMDREDGFAPGGTVSDAEYWKARREGRQPQQPFAKEAVQALRERLYQDFSESKNWDDLAQRLESRGLTLERKGQGLVITNGEHFAKLSEMGKGVRLKSLEDRFEEEFDGYMIRRSAELARQEKEWTTPGEDGMTERERRTVEMLEGSEPDHNLAEFDDPVLEADAADMDFRYWAQVDAAHRSASGRVKYAERGQMYARRSEARQKAWVSRREQGYIDILAKVYRDPGQARRTWDELERKHGVAVADQMVRDNPLVLGKARGFRFFTPENFEKAAKRVKKEPFKKGILDDIEIFGDRSPDRVEAKKLSRYLTERRQKYRDAMSRLGHAQHKVEIARRKTRKAIRDLELFERNIGTSERLKKIMITKVRRRARALTRVTTEAIYKSGLAEDRKIQLDRARRVQAEKRLEQQRKRERGKALDINIGLFED
ncbi:relaxase/mobilization nuclease domain-containing protein [Magnetospira sp. QH-2]|uniref:relaxase/mobilization nuclease domain-containing protein n=1 Tax=Magnetospira sp. (strain QH-2) TaxID=1288970 RepID=UPI0003E814D5|nr:relaxase/mobilization nuclease domain-containing protein [Magnetospira sp. QH-2]CCQ74239.1 Protein of unknown function [Magnetospira sp. QH-2]